MEPGRSMENGAGCTAWGIGVVVVPPLVINGEAFVPPFVMKGLNAPYG